MPPPTRTSGSSSHTTSQYATPAQSPMVKMQSPSHSPSDFSYFSPHAPSSSSSSIPSPIGPTSPGTTSYPVITATVTTRSGPSSSSTSSYPSPPHHLQQPDMLAQFNLRLPHTPSLSLSSLRHPAPEVATSPPYVSTSRSTRTPGGYEDLPSPMDRSRRMPASNQSPLMSITSSPNKHTLSVQLPTSIQPEMVTISANKGDKLKVVADAWHMEDDCHYEWQISFPPHDIDMSAVHAKFDPDGRLTIDVRRLPRYAMVS